MDRTLTSVEGTEEPTELAPAQRVTAQQRQTLMAYARSGSIEAAAELLELSPQTVKNHLSDAYQRLGVKGGPQAIYLLMGGEDVLRALPPALPPHKAKLVRPPALPPHKAKLVRPPALRIPTMVDGELSLRQLRQAARVGEAEIGDGQSTPCRECNLPPSRATLTELVDWLSYYVRPGQKQAI